MPTITLLRHRDIGKPSCSRLVRALTALGHQINKVDTYAPELADTDILIRWGHRGRFPTKKGALVINTPVSIELGSNKGLTRKTLQEAGVSVPRSFFTLDEALDANTYPLIGRPSYHTQGKDVEYIEHRGQLRLSRSDYWAEYITKDREFRVYVFNGQALGVVEKVPENPGDIAWNAHRGATIIDRVADEYPHEIIAQAIHAAEAIGQTFSGVDIMTKGANAYVLELNSSIALSNPHRVSLFARAFDQLINQRVCARA